MCLPPHQKLTWKVTLRKMPEGIQMRLTDYLDLVDSFVSSIRLTLRAA